jgi:cobalt-precorrin-5B (C1)-methyltransferase
MGLPHADLQILFQSPTAEAALHHLRDLDATTPSDWVAKLYQALTIAIDERATAYIYTQTQAQVAVGTVLFDRQRQVIATSATGQALLQQGLDPLN